MSWLQGLFTAKKAAEEPPDSLKVYTDTELSNHVRLQITKNTSAEDIIHSMFRETNCNCTAIIRFLWCSSLSRLITSGFTDVFTDLRRSSSNFNAGQPAPSIIINSMTSMFDAMFVKKESDYEDQKFEHVGRLEKKNKKGIYVETRGYLNQMYFGFFNINKSKIKLFKLETLQLYIWEDDCANSFKIGTQKKFYFFRAFKEQEYRAWRQHLERRLDSSKHKVILLQMEKRILDNHLTLVNLMEESVQLAARVPEYVLERENEEFFNYVIANSRSPLDVNLLKWANLASTALKGDVDVQVLKSLSHTWDQIAADYYNLQFKNRFPEPDIRERRKPLRDIVDFHDFGGMIEEVQTIKSSWRQEKDVLATSQAIRRLCDQIYQITYKKFMWQYQLIQNDKRIMQQAKHNFIAHTHFEVPNFEFFWL